MTKTPHSRRIALGLATSLLALSAALAGCDRRSSDVPAPTTTTPSPGPSTAPDSGSTSGSMGSGSGSGTMGSGSMPPASAASQ